MLGSYAEGYGIVVTVLRWIEAFLTGRSQKVIVNGSTSANITSVKWYTSKKRIRTASFYLFHQ